MMISFQMSFQRHCCPKRAKPIYPMSPSLLGQGPMQGMTTQKHDFVPKFQFKQSKSVPQDNIHRGCGGIEKETIQRLSFMRPDMCKFTRAESCKPIIKYKSPECKSNILRNFLVINFNYFKCQWNLRRLKISASCRFHAQLRRMTCHGHARLNTVDQQLSLRKTRLQGFLSNHQAASWITITAVKSNAMIHHALLADLIF